MLLEAQQNNLTIMYEPAFNVSGTILCDVHRNKTQLAQNLGPEIACTVPKAFTCNFEITFDSVISQKHPMKIVIQPINWKMFHSDSYLLFQNYVFLLEYDFAFTVPYVCQSRKTFPSEE